MRIYLGLLRETDIELGRESVKDTVSENGT